MRELTEQERVRIEKLDEIREYTNPYPERFENEFDYIVLVYQTMFLTYLRARVSCSLFLTV